MASSPIVARWELSRRLASLRKERGVDVKTITDHLGFTRNYWSAVENDRTVLAEEKLELLLELLEVGDDERQLLRALREDARRRGWWDDHQILEDEVKRLFGLEFGARRILVFDGSLIPGLLQIPEYSRPLIESDPYFSPVDFDERVVIRENRKRIFEHGVEYVALIGEAALMQQPAGPEVQRKQLDHMLRMVEDSPSTIQIRVLPFSANPGIVSTAGTLVFFEFGEGEGSLPIVAWQEVGRPLSAIESDHEHFLRIRLAWQQGLERSLDEEASVSLIRRVADSIP